MKILVTGATGNIGKSVIKYLTKFDKNIKIFAGVRNIHKAKSEFSDYDIEYRKFDFEELLSFNEALDGIDCIFLLRPPHIANVKKYFEPLLDIIKNKGIKKIVFLSVQGAEKSGIIPHNKIEKYIIKKGFNYIFLRPSYFMQNLTTTLYDDLKNYNEIILPAGNTKFNRVDIENIGEVAANVICNFSKNKNSIIEITGKENLNFTTVVNMINTELNTHYNYRAINPISYFFIRKQRNTNINMIFVMIMLHFLPRFEKEPKISDSYHRILGKEATTLKEFINREKKMLKK